MATNETPGSTTGANLANKVKGVFTATHGAGESLRGNVMDAVDTAFGTRNTENVATANRGQAEVQQGVANVDNKYNQYAEPSRAPVQAEGAGVPANNAGVSAGGGGALNTGPNAGTTTGSTGVGSGAGTQY